MGHPHEFVFLTESGEIIFVFSGKAGRCLCVGWTFGRPGVLIMGAVTSPELLESWQN